MARRKRRTRTTSPSAPHAGAAGTRGDGCSAVRVPFFLYFLAVGCNGSASLKGALNNTGAASGSVTGAPTTYTDTTSRITAGWTVSSGALPTMFGNGTITTAAGNIPNVYAGP